ncbi:MAG: hypothetical protein M1288_01685 [Actinobacteria bacterium]|nr:hypothetical protein [Actinomycetota bacterium]
MKLSAAELDRHICLTGMPGAGKSWVGEELALQLGVPWVDLDLEIELHQSKSISEIFTHYGEDYFRIIETELLEDFLSSKVISVISLGGGTVVSESNCGRVKESAWTVYLRAVTRGPCFVGIFGSASRSWFESATRCTPL